MIRDKSLIETDPLRYNADYSGATSLRYLSYFWKDNTVGMIRIALVETHFVPIQCVSSIETGSKPAFLPCFDVHVSLEISNESSHKTYIFRTKCRQNVLYNVEINNQHVLRNLLYKYSPKKRILMFFILHFLNNHMVDLFNVALK